MSTKYYRPSYVNVDLEAISKNYEAISRLHPNKTVMAVVKADAYGLGSVQVAQHLMDKGAEFFAVATLDEAIELRMHGIKAKLLVMGVTEPKHIGKVVRHRLAVSVPSEAWLDEVIANLDEGDKPLWLHVKLDTGMNRIGIHDESEYKSVLKKIKKHPRLKFEGVFTHFSSADEDNDATEKAYKRFVEMISSAPKPEYIHAQNTAAALRYDMSECTAVRTGIGIYGYYPSDFIKDLSRVKLKASMQLVSNVAFIKDIEPGDYVSYGRTYQANANERLATLGIGYADGVRRDMQGYKVNIKGHDCEIVGRVCMDQLMVVVPESVEIGDPAIIIHNKKSNQDMKAVEQKLGTISYEVLCALGRRLPRIFHEGDDSFIYNELLK